MAESLLAAQPTGNTSLTRLQESAGQGAEKRKTNLLSALQQKTQVTGLDTSEGILQRQQAALKKKPEFRDSTQAATVSGLISNFQTQQKSSQQTGEFNKALGTQKIESGFAELKRLNAIGEDVAQKAASARGLFESAVAQADETVQLSMQQVVTSLAEFDQISEDITSNLDFSKAHDMQVAAQSILGSMKEAENAVIRTHGLESAEFQQFLATKSQSLALAQSQLQGQYGRLQAEIDVQISGQRVALQGDLRQSVEFARLNRQNTLNAFAGAQSQLVIQEAQVLMGLEQMRMNVDEGIVDFLAAIPGQAIDLAPLILQINAVADSIPEPEPFTGFSGFRPR